MSVPLTRVGNYQLEKEIGQGGMSKVWLAHHRLLENRKVAVKLLLSDDAEAIERFTREANITSHLRHEYIVQIFDHGYQHPYHYTVMEYVQGGSLRDLLKQHRPVPLELALHIFRRAGIALDYAHAHGVIHRDVSPGNILLEQGTDRVLLTDFGIARESGKASKTAINQFMGTPGYLSPEQATSAAAVTHLSDIYSLGVVLFEILSGELPWNHLPGIPGPNGGLFVPPMPLRSRGVQLPSEVDRIIETMLAIDPAKRYPSAQAAIEDLERVLLRHTSPTQVILTNGTSQPTTTVQTVRPRLSPAKVEMHPVEKALGPDLLKAPMQESRKHAELLSDPQVIAGLLNRWSEAGFFRRKLLGRLAVIHRITSSNVYYYTLRVLYEHREPITTVEEPDHKAIPVPLEKEEDRWSVELPAPKGFVDDPGGSVRLPGSLRVIACDKCKGIGRTVCPRCQGKQRIPAPVKAPAPTGTAGTNGTGGTGAGAGAAGGGGAKPSAGTMSASASVSPSATATATGTASTATAAAPKPVLIPCPECSGAGGLRCQRCDGVGRLIQKKMTTWRRYTSSFTAHDDLPRVDEQWLQRSCKAVEVYREQRKGGFSEEWRLVPELSALLDKSLDIDQDTRIILSEVSLSIIPITEFVFDLGDKPMRWFWKRRGDGSDDSPVTYSWHIYGFEQLLPKDWRFLNWTKLMATMLGALVLLLVIVLIVVLV